MCSSDLCFAEHGRVFMTECYCGFPMIKCGGDLSLAAKQFAVMPAGGTHECDATKRDHKSPKHGEGEIGNIGLGV